MVAAFAITARESLEAALLVGILLAYLRRTENRALCRQVWLGSGAAVLLSAFLAGAIVVLMGELGGATQETLEGLVMLLATGVLTYVLVWMRHQGRYMDRSLHSKLTTAAAAGSLGSIAALSFLAVMREGLETALYLSAMTARTASADVWAGAGVGFVVAIATGFAIYRGSHFLNLKTFFHVTSILLVIFGTGLVGQATHTFQGVGIFPGTISLWDTSSIIPDTGTIGGILRSLVGYTAAPSLLQVILSATYVAVLLAILLDVGSRETVTLYGEPFRPIGTSYRHRLYSLLRWPRLTTHLPAMMAVFLVGLVAIALLNVTVGPFNNEGALQLGPFESLEAENNLFNWAMWVVWLPLLSIGTVLLGRFWCGNLCPLRLVTNAARGLADRVLGKGSTTSPYLRIGWLLPATFILITFLVKWWPVQSVARYGAILFIVIFLSAAVVSFFFRQGTWCRYICPIGGWLARIARLSPLSLRADSSVCATCASAPCLKGTAASGPCPVLLNPSKLESNRNCLKCWQCVVNCPEEKASLRLGWRFPGTELLKPYAPDIWESLFVASLIGMYIATGHRSERLASLPWPLVFFGLIALATTAYLVFAGAIAVVTQLPFKRVVATFGYIFLPLEFSMAVIAFGDDALEFFNIIQPAASLLLGLGFVWSAVIAVAIVRNACQNQIRQLASALPVGVALLAILFLWLSWYASGTVVDLT